MCLDVLHDRNEVSETVAPSPSSYATEDMHTDMTSFLERRKIVCIASSNAH